MSIVATPVIYKDKVYLGMGQNPEHGPVPGVLWVINGALTGDITETGGIWSRGGDDFSLTLSTVAIKDDILYCADINGFLFCLDANTGQKYWEYDAFSAVWSSPVVVDGKVILADEDGDVAVLQHSKTKKLFAEINMGYPIYTTPVVKDKVLYIASTGKLFAISKK